MSARSIRRAVERRQQKLLRKQASTLAAAPRLEETPQPEPDLSPARLAANRANAQLSTGPTSPDGKAKSSLNGVKTGLTGRTVLLPTDDAAAYHHFVENFFADWNPATQAETALVQALADTAWRLLRIPALEMGIYAIGRVEFANLFDDHDASLRPALIEAHIYLAYHRQLNNLSIQETRLRRQRENDTAALTQLQSERHSRPPVRPTAVPAPQPATEPTAAAAAPQDLGFGFSVEEIEAAITGLDPASVSSGLSFPHAQPISHL